MKEQIDVCGNKLLTNLTLNFILGRASNEYNHSYIQRITNEKGTFMEKMIHNFLTNDECLSPHMLNKLTKKMEYKTEFVHNVNRMIH